MADYANFDLLIEPDVHGFVAKVLDSPGGTGEHSFLLPFDRTDIEDFVVRLGSEGRGGTKDSQQTAQLDPISFGQKLYSTIFQGEVLECFANSTARAGRTRIRIRIAKKAAELAQLPWEYLHNQRYFLALQDKTPIVRFVGITAPVDPLMVDPPLRVLVVVSTPSGVAALQVEKEWNNLQRAWEGLRSHGLVTLERLEKPTLECLQKTLRRSEYHVFHFIGHGTYESDRSFLLFEDENGQSQKIGGDTLASYLSANPIRLAILNACQGARSSLEDPFSGVAQGLVRQGVPAVIAMQFEITDRAAIDLGRIFYDALADGATVDRALTDARQAMASYGIEWGTPVLYLRSNESILFRVKTQDASKAPTRIQILPAPQPAHSSEKGIRATVKENLNRFLKSKTLKICGLAVASILIIAAILHIVTPGNDGQLVLQNKIPYWTALVMNAQSSQNYGLKPIPRDSTFPTQAFTSAQALTAVLSSKESKRFNAQIGQAFSYIENARRIGADPGWSYSDFNDTDQNTLPEIEAWVIIAKIHALRQHLDDTRRREVIQSIGRDLDDLVKRQSPDGGWSPVRAAPAATRTYSTVMSVWALVESQRDKELMEALAQDYSPKIRDGVNWLLDAYRDKLQWVPDARRSDQNVYYLGLSAQVLFVLYRAEHVVDWLPSNAKYLSAKAEFVKMNSSFSEPRINSVLDNTDQYVFYTKDDGRPATQRLEGMTFYWYPWSLLAFKHLAEDKTLSSGDRNAAQNDLLKLYAQSNAAATEAEHCCTFELAEYLFAIANDFDISGKH